MELLDQYLRYLQNERKYSPHTLVAYRRDLLDFAAWVWEAYGLEPLQHKHQIQQLQIGMLRQYLGTLQYERATIVRKLSSLRSFLKFHFRIGNLSHNPAGRMVLPKKHRKLPEYLQESSLEDIFALPTLPEEPKAAFVLVRDYCMLELLYGCGLRRAELVNLRWKNIDTYTRTLRILGKGNKQRIVPYGSKAREAMELYMQQCRRLGFSYQDHFVLTDKGTPVYDKLVYRVVRRSLDHLPLRKRSPHILRHTYATHMVNRGANLNAVKEMLGHSSLSATQVYVHNSITQLKEVYKKAHPRAQRKP